MSLGVTSVVERDACFVDSGGLEENASQSRPRTSLCSVALASAMLIRGYALRPRYNCCWNRGSLS